ncbi:EAL domain-containing protein [Shewanella sp. A25]|nr:EAL domain-containing protein [Shewanella shenzhenensis]
MPKALIKIIIIVASVLVVFAPKAQELPVALKSESYSVPEGLSQSTVTALAEDDSGYIWIGTTSGLNRFDGETFKHFLEGERSGLSSSFIQSLLFDNGKLLVGTENGLNVYNSDLETFEKRLDLNEAISSINDNGSIYTIGAKDKLIEINKTDFKPIKTYSNESFELIKKAFKVEEGYVIRNHDGNVYLTNKNNNSKLIYANATEIEKGKNGIYALNIDGSYVRILEESFEIGNTEKTIASVKNNEVFIHNLESLEKISIGFLSQDNDSLSQTAYKTKNHIIILPNFGTGFKLVNDNENIVKSLIQPKGNVWSITQNNKEIIISDDSNSISFYDENLNFSRKIDTTISGPKYVTIHNEKIFIGSYSGLSIIEKNEKLDLLHDGITTLAKNEKHNMLLVGTDKFDIFSMDLDEPQKIKKINLNKKYLTFQIVPTNDDSLLFATEGGLIRLSNNGVENTIFDEDYVYCVTETQDEYIFGTRTAIYAADKNNFTTKKIFTADKPIYSIANDNNDFIASSINELIMRHIGNFYRLSTNYGSQEEYNSQSGIFWNDTFIFGGISGISIVDKKSALSHLENNSIKTNISDLLVFNKSIGIDGKILTKSVSKSNSVTLKYSDYPFTLKFNSPTSSQKDIEYFYNLAGLSDSWIPATVGTNSSSATYTNLSSGHYTFNVYGENPVTKQKGPITSLDIYITPPWWLSNIAKAVYFLIALLIISVIVKSVLRRREVQKQIALSEERLKLSLWGSGDEMWDWDIETGNIFRSNIWGALEFPRDGQRSGKTNEDSNIHPMDQERVRESLNKHFYGETDHFEAAYRVKGKDENWVWILDRAKIVERDEKDNALRMTGTIKNISQFKQKEEQLKLFEKAIENISEGMFILDCDFRFVEVNDACCRISLRNKTDFIGSLLTFDLYPEAFTNQIRSMLKQQGRWANEVEASRGDKSHFHMELTIDAIYDELGELSHYVGVFSDISRRKQQEEELRKLTNNDLLTGLPNRSNLHVTLSNLVNKEIPHALMVLDLDNFKRINDSLGHQIGDQLLKLVSARIKSALPRNTNIYRLGGDEFAIVLDKTTDISACAVLATRVIDAFKGVFEIDGDKLVLGLSIGIVLYPEDEQSEQALLRKADIAMYHAKSAGGNCYQFYSESLNQHAIKQLKIENLIREGLKEDLFEVYYQPKVDLKRGVIAGMEALVRLNHPTHGLVPPNEFIPLAEENGLIVEIGEIVLRKACFAAQKWREQGLFSGRVAVNLSSRQFALPDLQQRIESILRLTQLPPNHLELEITEGTVIKQPEMAITVMQQLAKMGVSLALDDFGTGYSSLSYLKRFPIHTLKIDKAFVDDIDKSDRDLKMVDSIITIAHNMGLSVVGEGVEQTAQLNILKALKCEEIQGYIFSKAINEVDFTALLEADIAKNRSLNKII